MITKLRFYNYIIDTIKTLLKINQLNTIYIYTFIVIDKDSGNVNKPFHVEMLKNCIQIKTYQ